MFFLLDLSHLHASGVGQVTDATIRVTFESQTCKSSENVLPYNNLNKLSKFAIAQSAFRFLAPPCQAVYVDLWLAARIRVISKADFAIAVQYYIETSCNLITS